MKNVGAFWIAALLFVLCESGSTRGQDARPPEAPAAGVSQTARAPARPEKPKEQPAWVKALLEIDDAVGVPGLLLVAGVLAVMYLVGRMAVTRRRSTRRLRREAMALWSSNTALPEVKPPLADGPDGRTPKGDGAA